MGSPMSAHVARAGFALRSYDLNGAGNCASARRAAQGADLLITMLPDGQAVRRAVRDALPALRRGAIVVDMSSSHPAHTRRLGAELAARGIPMLDAPVSGAVIKARDATLSIMAGGDAEVLERARPVLEKMGERVFHCGPLGAGHATKALNNYLSAVATLASSEALLVARAFGLDPAIWLEVVNASTGRNTATDRKLPQQMLTRAFASGFSMAFMTKDLGIAETLARGLCVPAPYLRQTLKVWREAQRGLAAGADHTEIYRYLESLPPPRRSDERLPSSGRRGARRLRSAPGRRGPAPSRGAASRRRPPRRARRPST
jgi:3-hydroxyisobutyrate dehydrogenase